MSAFSVEVVARIADVQADDWDALHSGDDPFVEHAFLDALEASGSVGAGTGWQPLHVTVRRDGRLVGALPLYAKSHSYGEYIFDWSWANAAERAGVQYYPKLLAMAPFTPATGTRLLIAADEDGEEVVDALFAGAQAVREQLGASSIHLLFLNERELAWAQARGFMVRTSSQFHWHNEGYRDFDDYLSRFRSALRKQVRRERRQVHDSGLDVRLLQGEALGDVEWQALTGFYMDTCLRRGSGPYLTAAFFEVLRRTHAHRVLAVVAYDGSEPIAATLNFQRGAVLYGRYWGCREEVPALHFELCYYRLIEHAIEHGLSRFEAGAQGTHKLRRGFMPAAIHSAHWMADARLAQALAAYLPREAEAVREEMAMLAQHGPFHRAGDDGS